MLRCDDFYICPVCNIAYRTEDEARDCLCEHDVEETAGFICDCGEVFTSEVQAQLHIGKCGHHKPGCLSCNNYDEGKRHAPCQRPYFSDDMSPCGEYRKVKVVL